MIREQTKKSTRTRVLFNPRRHSIDLQIATIIEGEVTYQTIASNDPDPRNANIRKLPEGDLERGQELVENILKDLPNYINPNL